MKNLYQLIQKKLIILLLCCLSADLFAQDWTLINRILASDRAGADNYGLSVAISGNYAVVGNSNNIADTPSGAGAAYVYYNNAGAWTFVKKLKADSPVENSLFGSSVSISGDYIIVGAPEEKINNSITEVGAAYIFYKDQGTANSWGLAKKITGSTRSLGDYFGISVSISDDYAIVGAPGQDTDAGDANSSSEAGAAYVFYKDQGTDNSWGQAKKITATPRVEGAWFGNSVSVSGNYAVVGAYFEKHGAPLKNSAGAGYIFDKDLGTTNSWGLVARVASTTPSTSAFFGSSVSVDGEQAVLGAYGETGSQGAAYIFAKDGSTWTLQKRIVSSSAHAGDIFGYAVSISGNNVIIGSNNDDEDETGLNALGNAGSAYIFGKDVGSLNNWGLAKKIVASDRGAEYYFGTSVAISGNYAAASANGAELDGTDANPLYNAGAAYIFGDMTALPVTLAGFQAIKGENQALLSWTTASETNTDYFEVQRSADGKRWTALGRVIAAKASTTLQPYVYTDKTPNEGQNLYRLKMMDQDGTFTYSRMQSVSFDKSVQLAAYPNPVSNRLFFTQGTTDQIISVQITDLTGRVILTTDKISDQGLSLENLHAGLYIVRIKKKDDVVISRKVVIRR